MPKEFDACVKAGGKVRTQKIGKDHYRRICKTMSGKWVRGHKQKKKSR